MEQLDMTDKRTLDQMDEETESPSPKKLKLDQPIITGPKKVMRVLLKKVSTPAGTPIPRLSRASKDSAKSFLKQVTSSSKIMIDDDDYSSPSPKKGSNKQPGYKVHYAPLIMSQKESPRNPPWVLPGCFLEK